MPLARTAGRHGRPWRRMRQRVLEASAGDGGSDICLWCGHSGAETVNHNKPWSRFPELRMTRSNLSPIHGIEGCPVCRSASGGRRVCNSEVGDLIPFVEIFPRAQGSRTW